jgi:alpha-ketoglutarate-dependent taurine dioxygenase
VYRVTHPDSTEKILIVNPDFETPAATVPTTQGSTMPLITNVCSLIPALTTTAVHR